MIEDLRNNNHVIKHLMFGEGDIHCKVFDGRDADIVLAFFQIEKGEIGRKVSDLPDDQEILADHAQLLMSFTNKEGLDVTIQNLQNVREKYDEIVEFYSESAD